MTLAFKLQKKMSFGIASYLQGISQASKIWVYPSQGYSITFSSWWYCHCLWCSAWMVNVYCHRFSVHLRIYCFSKHPFLLWSWRAALWVEVCTIRIGVESREPWSFCAVYCRSAASTGNSRNGGHSDIASLKKISNNSTCMYPRRIVSVVIRVKVNITNCSPRKDFLNLTLWDGFWGYFGQIWGPKTSLLILTLLLAW